MLQQEIQTQIPLPENRKNLKNCRRIGFRFFACEEP